MFWNNSEKVFINEYQERKDTKKWEYNLLDKVIIKKTTYSFDSDKIWEVWLILSYTDKEDIFDPDTYCLLLKNWETLLDVPSGHIKKYYWELQDEFELLDKVEREAKELDSIEKQYKEKAKTLEKLSKKLNKDKIETLTNLHKGLI